MSEPTATIENPPPQQQVVSLHVWNVMVLADRANGTATFIRKFAVSITPESLPRVKFCECCDEGAFEIDDDTAYPSLDLSNNLWDVTVFDHEDGFQESIESRIKHWTEAGYEMCDSDVYGK